MRDRMNRKALTELIDSLGIERSEFCILASGALVIRGIWPDADDLDMTVSPRGFQQLKEKNTIDENEPGHFSIGDRVEFRVSDKSLWKTETVDGYQLIDIHEYLRRILISEREKDRVRIPTVRKYIEERKQMDQK